MQRIRSGFFVLCAFLALLSARPAQACQCDISLSACNELAASNLVFIGTVESVEPVFLSRWSLRNGAPLQALNDAYSAARAHPSQQALSHLKDIFLLVLPALPADEKSQLAAATTPSEVMALFNGAADRGLTVHFKVLTLFKHADDDDQKTNDREDRKDEDAFDVSTPFGDCGFDFQAGETYLVYASSEEGSDTYFTGSCTRTRRVTDAGDDLGYLFFYKNRREESARLEGFATTDPGFQIDFNQLHNPKAITSPATGATIELRSDRLTRDAPADGDGRFLFDGLPAGDYTVAAYAKGYPSTIQVLADPQNLHIAAMSCARKVLLLRQSH